MDHLEGEEQRSPGEWWRQGWGTTVWLTETDMNFRMLGLAVMRLGVGKPGSQGKLDGVRVQQEPGDQGRGKRASLCSENWALWRNCTLGSGGQTGHLP